MSLKIKLNHLLCGTVILLALFSGQSSKLFNFSGGMLFQVLIYSKYIATAGLLLYALSRRKRKVSDKEIINFFKMYYPLLVLILVVELVAAFMSPVPELFGIRYWTRAISTFVDKICIFLAVVSTWMLCGKSAIRCMVNTFLFDEFLIFLSAIPQVGIKGVLDSFIGIFSFAEGSSNYFEVHELTFCIGACLVYYLFFKNEKNQEDFIIIFLLIISFLIGAKRIGILAIAMAGLFSLIVKRKGLSSKMLTIVGICGICICYIYLALIYSGVLFEILDDHSVNNMGRDLIYAYFTRRTTLEPSQLGWGMAGVVKVVENMNKSEVYHMVGTRGLHNDIMKVYINLGFIGSFLWYIFNLIYIPRMYLKKYGKKVATLYMSLALYMFITYLTDNTEGYFVCQMTFLLIPIVEYLRERDRYV